MPEPNYS